jgi:hypothetical protein
MTRVAEVIREWLGGCPYASRQKTRTFTETFPENLTAKANPCDSPAPPATTTAPTESRPAYQENILLIFLLVGGMFSLMDLRMLAFVGIISALAVYYDACTLHAGEKFEIESILGEVVTWRPLSWAICVLIGSLIFLALYTFSRREIFDANN